MINDLNFNKLETCFIEKNQPERFNPGGLINCTLSNTEDIVKMSLIKYNKMIISYEGQIRCIFSLIADYAS